jgi:hypothetical protein
MRGWSTKSIQLQYGKASSDALTLTPSVGQRTAVCRVSRTLGFQLEEYEREHRQWIVPLSVFSKAG